VRREHSETKAETKNCYEQGCRQLWGTGARAPSTSNNFIFSSLQSKSDCKLFKYCVVCEISWCRCQQLSALSISTALATKLLVIEQLLHPALKSAVSVPWHNFELCPSVARNLGDATGYETEKLRDRDQSSQFNCMCK